jgi:hypothetical protein
MLLSKIYIFKNKKYYFDTFLNKKYFKKPLYHNLKHYLINIKYIYRIPNGYQ